ncbi:MAG: archease [Candidatus Aenigmarchaeota archaeon]|nr:archease [Candidatus Aenigmarchaeota archaeon]
MIFKVLVSEILSGISMRKYKIIDDLKSDVMFEAFGKNLKELFENAAEALFSIICDVSSISHNRVVQVEVRGNDLKDLMFNWLQELIATVDIEEMFLSKFEIDEIDEHHLKAKCYGEPIKPEKGDIVVKAVTYHKFGVEKTKDGYKVSVTLDI